MDTKMLLKLLENQADPAKVSAMEAYMKNKFSFLGVQKPILKKIEREFFKPFIKDPIDWTFVEELVKHNHIILFGKSGCNGVVENTFKYFCSLCLFCIVHIKSKFKLKRAECKSNIFGMAQYMPFSRKFCV